MKTKKILSRQLSQIKNVAKLVNPAVSKKETILAKMEDLNEELKLADAQIQGFQAPIKELCLGLTTEDLIKKVVEPAFDKDGNPVLDSKTGKQANVTKYVPVEKYLQPDPESTNGGWVLTLPDIADAFTGDTEQEETPDAQPEVQEDSFDESNPFA